MSRSVKDLRELINISRLSFHGEEELFNDQFLEHNMFQNGGNLLLCGKETRSNTCLNTDKDIEGPERSLRNGRFTFASY